MKLRLILIAIVLGIFVAPAWAQSQNCTYLTWFNSGDAKNWNAGNQYIASETKTYTVTCTNTKTNAVTYSGANATTATGQGGWNASYTKFIACNPIFNYSAANPPTTASDNYFDNIGQD